MKIEFYKLLNQRIEAIFYNKYFMLPSFIVVPMIKDEEYKKICDIFSIPVFRVSVEFLRNPYVLYVFRIPGNVKRRSLEDGDSGTIEIITHKSPVNPECFVFEYSSMIEEFKELKDEA